MSPDFRHYSQSDVPAIVELFESVFTASEGQDEGVLIGQLARHLFDTTSQHDLFNYVAEQNNQIVGAIFLSRLFFDLAIDCFILAPVAVHTGYQSKGIGQALIRYGLDQMKQAGVQAVLTYGDPRFYKKIGFQQISDKTVSPPYKLSLPGGWLGQSLNNQPIDKLNGRCACVQALKNQAYW